MGDLVSPLTRRCDTETRDGKAKLHIVVDGETLVSAEPADAIVFRGSSCDEMLFFSSEAGLDAWKKKNAIEGGKVFTLTDAGKRGGDVFGKLTQGFDG